MNWAAIVWFVLMLVFLIVEGICAIHMVSLWFAAGSLAAMLIALLKGPMWLQVTLFIVVSCALLVLFLPFVKKFLNPTRTKTNVDAIIGSQGYITADIDNLTAEGQVKLGAMEWTARSTGGEKIPKGTLVKVDRIEGVKAFVSQVKETVEI